MTRRKMKRAGVHLVPSENGWALQRWLSPANLVQRAHRLGTADATTAAVSKCTCWEKILIFSLAIKRRHDTVLGSQRSGRSAVWLARLVRVQEVVGSNPTAPISFSHLSRCGNASASTVRINIKPEGMNFFVLASRIPNKTNNVTRIHVASSRLNGPT